MGLYRILRQNFPILFSLILGLALSYIVTSYLNVGCKGNLFEEDISVRRKSDEYEPRINLAGKPQRAKKIPKNLVRPRYYSTELGIKQRLFMGVLTSEETVRTLVLAFNKTSSHFVDKIMFFMDAAGAEKAKVSQLKLPGIVGFMDTKELLKPFHMIKYLTDNFLEEFDFFFLSKDTTYVNAKTLDQIVRKISVSENIHAGGKLTGEGSSYCSLDGGILLSNSVLKKIQSSLDWCVKNSYSDSHDDNIGRCILHACQIPCSQTVQGNTLESYKLRPGKKIQFESTELGTALTYYPITDENVFYELHLWFCKKRLSMAKSELSKLKKKVDLKHLSWPPGSYPPKVPNTRFDLVSWQLFDLEKTYLPSDFVNVKPMVGVDLQDANNILNKTIDWVMNRYPGEFHFRRLVNGYKRFDASRGLDYILDLAFKDNSGHEVIKRIEVSKPLGRVEMLPMPYVTESTRVFLLLPILDNEKQHASDLITKYSQSCSQTELTFLLLILLYEPTAPGKGHEADVFKEIKNLAQNLSSKKHRDCKITWISIKVPEIDGKSPLEDHLTYFAISDLVSKKLGPESLVLFTEPHMELRKDYLNRVRMGTISAKQVYSPIPFTEYSPEVVYRNVTLRTPTLEIRKNTGRFDTGNTRHLSFYLSDYLTARFNVSHYLPFVKGDKDIIRMFSTYKESNEMNRVSSLLDMFSRQPIHVLRATEPSLRLTRLECRNDFKTNQRLTEFRRCNSPMATRSQLGQIVLDFKEKLKQV